MTILLGLAALAALIALYLDQRDQAADERVSQGTLDRLRAQDPPEGRR